MSRILDRCDALAALTEEPGRLTRTYLREPHRAANAMVMDWMRDAGMTAHVDAVGNVVGRLEGARPGLPAVMVGSHLDTVRDAGRYDGMLGVVLGIEAAAALAPRASSLPFALEVIGFGDEEGVRFASTLIGSRAVAGTLDPAVLEAADADGITIADALRAFGLDPAAMGTAARSRDSVAAFLEVHIEQGPVLESEALPVGVVDAICGATRRRVTVTGQAGHAGTVPMNARADALTGAADMVLAVESTACAQGVVATVGRLSVEPDAVNVIPGQVTFTVDLRAGQDAERALALGAVDRAMEDIAARRGLLLRAETFHDSPAVACDPALQDALARAVTAQGLPVRTLSSGAGHDAMAMAALCPAAMLFVRCTGGISHNPAESVTADDVEVARRVLLSTLDILSQEFVA